MLDLELTSLIYRNVRIYVNVFYSSVSSFEVLTRRLVVGLECSIMISFVSGIQFITNPIYSSASYVPSPFNCLSLLVTNGVCMCVCVWCPVCDTFVVSTRRLVSF